MTFDGTDTSGILAWMRTVYLSRTSTLSMVSKAPRRNSWPMAGSLMRMRLSFTASASTSRPLWNSTPLRSRKVQAVSSLLGSQLSARLGHDVALLIDIGQAVIHRGRGLVDVMLILNMRVEAGNIGVRAILQSATPLRMPLCRPPPRSTRPKAAMPASAPPVVTKKSRRESSNSRFLRPLAIADLLPSHSLHNR